MADFYTYRNEVAGRRRKRRLFLILVVVLAVLSIGTGYFWFARQSAPAQTSPAETATPEQAASAAAPTGAPSAAPADIAEPQRILPSIDTAAWDKSEAVASTIDTEYRNTDHRMVAVPMLGTVTNDYFNTVTFAGDSIASGLGIYDTGYHNAHYATYVSAGVQTFVNNVSVKNAVTGANETPMETIAASQPDYLYILVATVNDLLANMALLKGCYYINIREALTNPADGSQIDDYATKDGVHFNAAGYHAWAEYLATHTVWNRRSVYSGENPYYIYGT